MTTLEITQTIVDEAVQHYGGEDDAALGYATAESGLDADATVYVDQIPDILAWHIENPELHGHTLCFLGSSAIGKTHAVRQGFERAAERLFRTPVLHEMHVSQLGPTDIIGVPRDDGQGRTVWYPPRKFALASAHPDHAAAYEAALAHHADSDLSWTYACDHCNLSDHPLYGYFWDEVTNPSSPSIVHQAFSLWYGNFVADHPLVPDAVHVLAGNRVQDGTNSVYLARSASSRLSLLEVLPRFTGWLRHYAAQPHPLMPDERSRIHPTVVSYLNRFSDRFAPDVTGTPQMAAFPSPRAWSYVSDLIYANEGQELPKGMLQALVAGRVGTSDAQLFFSFLEHWRELPDVARMLDSPDDGSGYGWLPDPWPTRPDVLWIMGAQMVSMLNASNAKRFMRFLLDEDKLPPDIMVGTYKLLSPYGKLEPLAMEWAYDEMVELLTRHARIMFR